MKKKLLILAVLFVSLLFITLFTSYYTNSVKNKDTQPAPKKSHWFLLQRKNGRELLYYGVLGDLNNSRLIKTFQVKTGVNQKSPTPLPNLLGREYWLITKKESSIDNPETAPYFLTLNIPATDNWPYGPIPYMECNGQCEWTFGYFGLHGVNGNSSKLSSDDLGSSGCVRHTDKDIEYLYNLLDPETEEIRYYIKDD